MTEFTSAHNSNIGRRVSRVLLVLAFSAVTLACSWEPETQHEARPKVIVAPTAEATSRRAVPVPRSDRGQRVADIAKTMIDTPYKWGGATTAGFDCSGLVYYAYAQLQIPVPRTAAQQRQRAHPISLRDAQPGDLLFFEISGKTDHVGVYLGGHRFVHAPASGKTVQVAQMNNPFYRRHLVSVGRIISAD